MNRKAKVYFKETIAGLLIETEDGYEFTYDKEYIKNNQPISITLPLTENIFFSKTMFPFFDGLIPEGWLLDIASKTWKINPRDRMGLLISCCNDCIGAVSIKEVKE